VAGGEAWGGVQPGDVIGGKYRLEQRIGEGGFGAVYRARQLDLERDVAVKVLLPEAAASEAGLTRFLREAELAQRLTHPNTVRIYDFGRTELGAPFIVWELLRGRPLDVVLRDGPLEPARVVNVGAQILKSLMEAHALGVVHRDIKPSNLFLTDHLGEADHVTVLDFGIAHVAGSAVTVGGTMLGTPAYMSPEQVSGGEITAATDLYALGLVLAECLAGAPIYAGSNGIGVALAQMSDAPVPLPEAVLRSPLAGVITRATRKDAALRPRSAEEMLSALAAVPLDRDAPRASRVVVTVAPKGAPDVTAVAASPRAISLAIAPSASTPGAAPALGHGRVEVEATTVAMRRAALALGFGAVATLLVVVYAARQTPAEALTPVVEGPDAAAPWPSAKPRARPTRHLKASAAHVRARLRELGVSILADDTHRIANPPSLQTVLTVTRGAQSGVVSVWIFDREIDAVQNEDALASASMTVARDGSTVVATSLGGRALIDAITR
jgi:serine/threonine-protein kinase